MGRSKRTPAGRTMVWRLLSPVLLATAPGVTPAAGAEELEEPQADMATGANLASTEDQALRPRTRRKARLRSDMTFDAALLAGYFSGLGVRPDSAPMSLVAVGTKGSLDGGWFRLKVPFDFQYRETPGADLREIKTRVAPVVRLQPNRWLWVEAGGGADVVRRPGWPDLYQPIPEEPADPPAPPEGYVPSDRFSFQAWQAKARIGIRPAKRQRIKATYRYRLSTWEKDPNFHPIDDPDADPNHLVPGDNEEHRVGLRWRWTSAHIKMAASITAFRRDYFYAYARDAGTGKTHASSGSVPPNPLQQFRGIRPAVTTELRFLDARLRCATTFGYDVVQDTFQGYYSYTAPRPGLRLRYRTKGGVALSVATNLRFRRYGPNSFAATPDWQPGMSGHPPLTFGDRRVDARTTANTELRFPIGRQQAVTIRGDLWVRRTNFPDYQPGIFPSLSNYDIQWNYRNWRVLTGLAIAW